MCQCILKMNWFTYDGNDADACMVNDVDQIIFNTEYLLV